MRFWYLITPATGARAQKLIDTNHSLLKAKENTVVRTLETVWEPQCGETLADEPGQETFCTHLAEMSKPTGISGLDYKPTVWQTNWVFPVIEPGTVLTEKGDRFLLIVTLQDRTGQTTVTMNENYRSPSAGVPTKMNTCKPSKTVIKSPPAWSVPKLFEG